MEVDHMRAVMLKRETVTVGMRVRWNSTKTGHPFLENFLKREYGDVVMLVSSLISDESGVYVNLSLNGALLREVWFPGNPPTNWQARVSVFSIEWLEAA